MRHVQITYQSTLIGWARSNPDSEIPLLVMQLSVDMSKSFGQIGKKLHFSTQADIQHVNRKWLLKTTTYEIKVITYCYSTFPRSAVKLDCFPDQLSSNIYCQVSVISAMSHSASFWSMMVDRSSISSIIPDLGV
jgi:hypothetical protein